MFEHDNIDEFDLQMRSILEGGQEEVPAGLWEGVSAGLDKAARRRKAALWIRYSGIAVAAAAAVAVGFVFNRNVESDLVPAVADNAVAVVEEITVVEEPADEKQYALPEEKSNAIEVIRKDSGKKDLVAMTETVTETADQKHFASEEEPAQTVPSPSVGEEAAQTPVKTIDVLADEIDWADEPEKKRIRTSLVISGIAGTNSPQNTGGLKPLRAPGAFKDPVKTTIEQIGEETNYGIPVSVGLGVKINFNTRWSLGVGVNYTLLTSSFNGKYTEVNNGVASMPVSERTKNTQHYIGIPVNAYYNIVSRDFINFYAYAGGTVEKCVANRYQVQTTPVINHQEAVKGVQLSANAGIGVEFLLGKHVGIYLDPSLRYYFSCRQPQSIRTAQPLMLGFEAGVRFNL